VVLKPGEQAVLTHDSRLTIDDAADTSAALAWKNGYFRFNNTNITAIMRQAARWYDAEVIYQGDMTDEFFSGNVPRSANISSLLKILELTKTIRCTVKDRKIIIQPY
jgi:ferric-dicitrate binding protein FerR (iron transport regulator)